MDIYDKVELAEKYEKAKSIKHYLCRMTDKCGAVMNPIALAHLALEYLQTNQPNNNNTSLARNLAYLYSCLCNEFCIMSRKKQVKESGDFYMTKATWEKYMLGGRIKEQTKLLEKMGWIKCCIKTYSTKPYKREHYSINLPYLILLAQLTSDLVFESEKAAEHRAKNDYEYISKPKKATKSKSEQLKELMEKIKVETEIVISDTDS